MFKKSAYILTVIYLIAFFAVAFYWQDDSGIGLYSNSQVTRAYRMNQDLGGNWEAYGSLQEAFNRERISGQGKEEFNIWKMFNNRHIILPSNKGFQVAAKKFKVTGKWGAKTAQLVLNGVYGKARLFLNGIDEVNFLGEVDGLGGNYTLEIAAARLNYSDENELYIEMSPGSADQRKLFGWFWPEKDRISGKIYLEAVPETTIDDSQTVVSYDRGNNKVTVSVNILHHQELNNGPWLVSGGLSKNKAKIAECILPITPKGEYEQRVILSFTLPEIKEWDPQNPNLYDLDLLVANSRGDFDRVQMPIGFSRHTIANGQWSINGKVLKAKSKIINADQAYALQNQLQVNRFLTDLKTQGFNVIYFMGFFPDEEWLEAADKIGIGVWLELPLTLVPKQKIPDSSVFDELILLAGKHPSVTAWTTAKFLEPSAETQEYYQQINNRIPFVPLYYFGLNNQTTGGPQEIIPGPTGLEGTWGSAEFTQEDFNPVLMNNPGNWPREKLIAWFWFFWLLFLSLQNWRVSDWNYKELNNPNPKRSVRLGFIWRFLAFLSRMATLGALAASLIYVIPLPGSTWLPYDSSFILELKSQSPYLLWIVLSASFSLVKILQVGLASAAFPKRPGVLGLCCWLERRYLWLFLAGAAWVISCYGFSRFVPLIFYFVMSFILLPLRIRDIRKIGGKYSSFLIIPLTVLGGAVIVCIWHWQDVIFFSKNILPLAAVFFR